MSKNKQLEPDEQKPEELKYFNNMAVLMFITNGVAERIPKEVINWLYMMVFIRAEELRSQGMEMSYFQFLDIKSNPCDEHIVQYTVELQQEQPDSSKLYIGNFEKSVLGNFNGRIYIIESWNGEPTINPNEHYITMLLPEEY